MAWSSCSRAPAVGFQEPLERGAVQVNGREVDAGLLASPDRADLASAPRRRRRAPRLRGARRRAGLALGLGLCVARGPRRARGRRVPVLEAHGAEEARGRAALVRERVRREKASRGLVAPEQPVARSARRGARGRKKKVLGRGRGGCAEGDCLRACVCASLSERSVRERRNSWRC